MTAHSEKAPDINGFDLELGIPGFFYSDLYDAVKLKELAEKFYAEVEEKEPVLGEALKKIAEMRSLEDPHAKLILLNFASAVAARNPFFRSQMEDTHRQMFKIIADMSTSTPERYEAMARR